MLYRHKWLAVLIVAMAMLLSGCVLGTVDELYCLPKRAGDYKNLQAVIDDSMTDLTYCAPLYGDNRQVVQSADLDGDGVDEFLLFASDNSEQPLKILIFSQLASGFVLADTIEGYGFGFDFVTYAQMDDKPGLEIVVGRQVSDQITRSVCVYRFSSGMVRQLLSTGCSQALTSDMDGNGISELFVLMPGVSENNNATARFYHYRDGEFQRSAEVTLSGTMDAFKQISAGILHGGKPAVYVTCASSGQMLLTDIFCMDAGSIQTFAAGIQTPTLHNYYVYPEDVDKDGVMELPRVVQLPAITEEEPPEYIIEWYSLREDQTEIQKRRTYHNYADNWSLLLNDRLCDRLSVQQTERECTFYYGGEKVFTILVLTDADKEQQSTQPGRTILYSSETAVYVAEFMPLAYQMQISEDIIRSFSPIRVEMNSEKD